MSDEQNTQDSNVEIIPQKAAKLVITRVKDRITKKEGIALDIDKRTTISKYNRFSHGKFADLPAYCNNCVFRSREAGGGGQCPSYEKDAACAIRKDIAQFIAQYDTREPEALKEIMDQLIHVKLEDVIMATALSRMDGNLPDKSQRAEFNSLVQLLKLSADMNTAKVTATEETLEGDNGLRAIFKSIAIKKFQEKSENA